MQKKAILASLDSPWSAKEDLKYALLIIKISLIFFDAIVIDDSEIIDSNQMRYAISVESTFQKLVERNRILLARRKGLEDLLKEVINRETPMLFSSLDFVSNERLLSLRMRGSIDLDSIYVEFDQYDFRTGLKNILIPYRDYISRIGRLMDKSIKLNIREELFSQKFEFFAKEASLGKIVNFPILYRTEAYNQIEGMKIGNPYKERIIKDGLKALSDIIYILNKSYNTEDPEIYVLFDSRHYEEIERGLKGINLDIEKIKDSYYGKNIKIIKINFYEVYIDDDINFFVNTILPTEIIVDKKENLPDELLRFLEEKGDFEKLSFLKFIKKREKYSRLIERKYPRLRSLVEILVLFFASLSIYLEIVSTKRLDNLSIGLIVISILVTFDGILGFMEYKSSKKINTHFFEKILDWYREHNKKVS